MGRMTTYAVTGATGGYAAVVIDRLLARGVAPGDVVALARRPGAAARLTGLGVQVRHGDYDDPDSLTRALDGVDRLLLVSGVEVGRRLVQHTNVVEAAVRSGVGRLLYTSLLHADTSSVPLAEEHVGTERAIDASGLAHSILRNGWYTENFTAVAGQYLTAGVIAHAAGSGRAAAATRADLAEAGAVVLLEDFPEQVYELAGPGFTYDDLAEAITDLTGTAVTARDLGAQGLMAALRSAGLDEGAAGFVVAVDAAIAAGDLDGEPAALEALLGRPATGLRDALRDVLPTAPR